MTGPVAAVLVAGAVAVLVTVAWLMRRSWARRTRRSGDLVGELPPVPTHLGAALAEPAEGLYLGTTVHDAWLDRVTAHGLGARGAVVLHVHEAGVLVARGNVPDLFVPRAALLGVDRVTGFAGKVLTGHGVLRLTWRPPGASGTLDTGLRLRHGADHDRALIALTTLTTEEQA